MTTVVHVVEIRLREDQAWDICDVYAHQTDGPGAARNKIAEVTNRLRDYLKAHGHDDVTGTKTYGGEGLVKTETFINHRQGTSFFRHTIREGKEPGEWLDIKGEKREPAT